MGNTYIVGYYPNDLYGQDRVTNNVVDIGAVESLPISSCDFNSDSVVNFGDFVEFISAWDTQSGDPDYDVTYDLDTDGYVNTNDLTLFADQWLYGHISSGMVTATYQVDFGYRPPDLQLLMLPQGGGMELMAYALDSVYAYDNVAQAERLESAKAAIAQVPATLSAHKYHVPAVAPAINAIAEDRQGRAECYENLLDFTEYLHGLWLRGEIGTVMTEQEYLEIREGLAELFGI